MVCHPNRGNKEGLFFLFKRNKRVPLMDSPHRERKKFQAHLEIEHNVDEILKQSGQPKGQEDIGFKHKEILNLDCQHF